MAKQRKTRKVRPLQHLELKDGRTGKDSKKAVGSALLQAVPKKKK
ncbi:hypothetical protein [Tenacibaculum sp.]